MKMDRRGLLALAGTAALTGAVTAVAGPGAAPAHAATGTAVVDPAQRGPVWEGFGTALCWFAHRIGGTAAVRDTYADLLFDRDKGLGLNIVRYNIGGGENPAYPGHMDLRARVPGYLASATAAYDWSADPNQRWFLQAAKSRIPASEFLAESFANSPPWWMTISGSVTGGRNAAENLRTDSYEAFARYLVTVNERFRTTWGVPFRTLSPVNEPSAAYWTFGNRQEGNRMLPANQATMLRALADELARQGSPTRIAASDETSIDVGRDTVNSWSAQTRGLVGQYNVHSYEGSDRTGFKAAARGGRIWDSEHGNGDASGMTLSQNILWDVKWLGASAFAYWQAVDSGGWGMLDTDLNNASADLSSYTRNKKFWAMAQWSHYVRRGYRVIGVSDNDTVAFHDEAGRRVVLVTVNNTSTPATVTYDLSRFAPATATASGVRTSGSQDLAALPSAALAGNRFTASAPAMSTTTWVVPSMTLN